MSSRKARIEPRTPQACVKCRSSKIKCNGVRPQCGNCLKHGRHCTWPRSPIPGNYHAITPPGDSPRSETTLRPLQVILDLKILIGDHFSFPEPRQLQWLLEIFYTRHHDAEFCSFFHKPSLDVVSLSQTSPFLVSSIISLSALYLSVDEARDFGFETPSDLSDHYSRLAKLCASTQSDVPKISSIQAYLILSIRELITWSSVKAFMLAGSAIRMSQALNLSLEVPASHSVRDKEVRRRTFWACIVVDRLISYSSNKPFTMNMPATPLQLPCPPNAFSFEEDYSGPNTENLSLYADQVSRVGVQPFFISMVMLWADMAAVHTSSGRRRSKYGPHNPESDFYRANRAIDGFYSRLPMALTWSSQNYKLHQVTGQAQAFVNLNFILYHSRCVMNQEYLPQLDSQYSILSGTDDPVVYDAAGISLDEPDLSLIKPCISATNGITDMAITLYEGSDYDRQLLQSIFAANAILTASAVHLWVLYTQTCDACPKDLALAKAEKLREIIKSWKPQWRVATAWVETLEILYKLYVYSYGKIVDSELDCLEIDPDEMNDNTGRAEITEESGLDPTLDGMEGVSSPSEICQRMYDKIRGILVNPLLPTDVKKRNLTAYSRTLWQHMWIQEPLMFPGEDTFADMQDFMGDAWNQFI